MNTKLPEDEREEVEKTILSRAITMGSELRVAFDTNRSPESILNLIMTHLRQFNEKREAEVRKECSNIVRSHALTDWSGETEIYEELEKIAKKIELSHQINEKK